MRGTVKFFNESKGFGFIEGENGKDYFVHQSALGSGIVLEKSNEVTFEVEDGTSAGVYVPIPSSNFVLRGGDTMTGDLTSTGFTGSLFGTASVAVSASWAPVAGQLMPMY